LLIKHFILLNM